MLICVQLILSAPLLALTALAIATTLFMSAASLVPAPCWSCKQARCDVSGDAWVRFCVLDRVLTTPMPRTDTYSWYEGGFKVSISLLCM
jgi:hypothetical protein